MLSLAQLGVAVVVFFAAGLFWFLGGRHLREAASGRLLYGLPLGTLVAAGFLLAVYLFLQDGLGHWDDPVVFPFVSWSYGYPAGMVSAAFTHSSPSHIISNLSGLVAFGVIVEYAWGHSRDPGGDEGVWPWMRALVVFPAILLGGGLITGLVSLGPGLGFSGAVYALFGAAVVTFPGPSLLAVLATSVLSTAVSVIQEPLVEGTVEPAPPAPPDWAGIGFHAHAVGFVLGVLFGLWLLNRDLPRPSVASVTAATFVVGLVQSLWLIVLTPAQSTFLRYDGVGFALLVVVAGVVGIAAGGSSDRLSPIFGQRRWIPTRRQLGVAWTFLVVLGGGAVVVLGVTAATVPAGTLLLFVGAGVVVALLPVLLVFGPTEGGISRRHLAAVVLAMGLVVIAVPGIYSGGATVADANLEDRTTLAVEDYQLVYGTNLTVERGNLFDGPGERMNTTGTAAVAVASERRHMWTLGVRSERLAVEPTDTVVVGDVGWREEVSITRSAWDVVGNETVYAVDLATDDQCVRSFKSPQATAGHTLAEYRFAVVPTPDGFAVQVKETSGRSVGRVAVPPVNQSTTVNALTIATTDRGDSHSVEVSHQETTVTVAERPADAPAGCDTSTASGSP